MAEFPVAVPPADLLERFNRHAQPLWDEQKNLLFTARNLRRTRDLLLPRLLSGQLDVGIAG